MEFDANSGGVVILGSRVLLPVQLASVSPTAVVPISGSLAFGGTVTVGTVLSPVPVVIQGGGTISIATVQFDNVGTVGVVGSITAPLGTVGYLGSIAAPLGTVGYLGSIAAPLGTVGYLGSIAAPLGTVGYLGSIAAPLGTVGYLGSIAAPLGTVGYLGTLASPITVAQDTQASTTGGMGTASGSITGASGTLYGVIVANPVPAGGAAGTFLLFFSGNPPMELIVPAGDTRGFITDKGIAFTGSLVASTQGTLNYTVLH